MPTADPCVPCVTGGEPTDVAGAETMFGGIFSFFERLFGGNNMLAMNDSIIPAEISQQADMVTADTSLLMPVALLACIIFKAGAAKR